VPGDSDFAEFYIGCDQASVAWSASDDVSGFEPYLRAEPFEA
jgi:hypothetical protein